MADKKFSPDGPIPGENYTSDTRNYAWHRPPDISDMDEAIEASMKKLTSREGSYSLLTMLQAGMPVVTAADLFVTTGIQAGKWTPDMALLLGGPIAHIMKLMAEGYGIKYDMGLDDDPVSTIEFLKAKAEIDPRQAVTVANNVKQQLDTFKAGAAEQAPVQENMMGAPVGGQQTKASGFMGMPAPEEQPAPVAPEGMMGEA